MEIAEKYHLTSMAFAIVIFIMMIVIDYTWGNFIFSFADSMTADNPIIIKLMVTITLGFATIILPILVATEKVNPNPLNVVYGIGSMLIAIPAMMMITTLIVPIMDLFLTDATQILIINLMIVITIIMFGFIAPIFAMLQPENIDLMGMMQGEQ